MFIFLPLLLHDVWKASTEVDGLKRIDIIKQGDFYQNESDLDCSGMIKRSCFFEFCQVNVKSNGSWVPKYFLTEIKNSNGYLILIHKKLFVTQRNGPEFVEYIAGCFSIYFGIALDVNQDCRKGGISKLFGWIISSLLPTVTDQNASGCLIGPKTVQTALASGVDFTISWKRETELPLWCE